VGGRGWCGGFGGGVRPPPPQTPNPQSPIPNPHFLYFNFLVYYQYNNNYNFIKNMRNIISDDFK